MRIGDCLRLIPARSGIYPPEYVCLEDIAQGLSNICRFTWAIDVSIALPTLFSLR